MSLTYSWTADCVAPGATLLPIGLPLYYFTQVLAGLKKEKKVKKLVCELFFFFHLEKIHSSVVGTHKFLYTPSCTLTNTALACVPKAALCCFLHLFCIFTVPPLSLES